MANNAPPIARNGAAIGPTIAPSNPASINPPSAPKAPSQLPPIQKVPNTSHLVNRQKKASTVRQVVNTNPVSKSTSATGGALMTSQ